MAFSSFKHKTVFSKYLANENQAAGRKNDNNIRK